MSVEARVFAVFRGVFGPEIPSLAASDSPDTVEGWDSANHLNLVMALEAEFGVEFEVDEIGELTSVGAIVERLSADGR